MGASPLYNANVTMKITCSNIGVMLNLEHLSKSATLERLKLDMALGGIQSITKLHQLHALNLCCGVYDLQSIYQALRALTYRFLQIHGG